MTILLAGVAGAAGAAGFAVVDVLAGGGVAGVVVASLAAGEAFDDAGADALDGIDVDGAGVDAEACLGAVSFGCGVGCLFVAVG